MNPSRTTPLAVLASALSLFSLSTTQGYGQTATATTDPVGYSMVGAFDANSNYLGIPANSDSVISLPFTQPPAYVGSIASVSQSAGTITVSGAPGWTANQYAKYGATGAPALPTGYTNAAPSRYYALIGANPASSPTPKEGSYYSVVSNDTSSLTLNLNNDNISTVTAGTQVLIIPYSTLGTIFPDADVTSGKSFLASTSVANLVMSILIPDLSFLGTNPGTAATYYYVNGTTKSGASNVGWRLFGDGTTVDHSIDPLPFGSYFTIRNSSSTATSLTVVGSVLTKKMTTPLSNETNKSQDNVLAFNRPAAQSLNQLGLISSGVFASSTSAANITDQLFVFDNSQPQTNRSASTTYYYINGTTKSGAANVGWRQLQSSTTDVGDTAFLQPGTGFIIRKGAGNGTTQFWTNAPNY